jgi:hypothetical protein
MSTFNGTDQYATLAAAVVQAANYPFFIVGTVTVTNVTPVQSVFCVADSTGDNRFLVYVAIGKAVADSNGSANGIATSNSGPTNGVAYPFIAIYHSASSRGLYDGSLATNATAVTIGTLDRTRVGAYIDDSLPFGGTIGALTVWAGSIIGNSTNLAAIYGGADPAGLGYAKIEGWSLANNNNPSPAQVSTPANDLAMVGYVIPTDFAGIAASTTQIDLTWTNVPGTGFSIDYEQVNSGTTFTSPTTTTAADNATSKSITGLTEGKRYIFRIKATGPDSAYASTIVAWTLPSTPTSITINSINPDDASISIDNASANLEGNEIRYDTHSDFSDATVVDVGSADVTEDVPGPFTLASTVYMQARAYVDGGNVVSPWTASDSEVVGPNTGGTPVSCTIGTNGTTITIVMSEATTFDDDGSGVLLHLSGGNVSPTYASGIGTATLVYTSPRVISSGETETTGKAAYTQSGTGWQDSDGNLVESFTGLTITNNSTQLIVTGISAVGVAVGQTVYLFPGITISTDQTAVEVTVFKNDGDEQLDFVTPLPSGLSQGVDADYVVTTAPMTPANLQIALRLLQVTRLQKIGTGAVTISIEIDDGVDAVSNDVNVGMPINSSRLGIGIGIGI